MLVQMPLPTRRLGSIGSDYGAWDYKRRLDDHEVYQDFGNFNFGMTGAARGHSLEYLLAGAWADQTVKNLAQVLGSPFGLSSHPGDSPDQPLIGDQPVIRP